MKIIAIIVVIYRHTRYGQHRYTLHRARCIFESSDVAHVEKFTRRRLDDVVSAWGSLDATRLAAELLVLLAEHLRHVVAPRVLVAVLTACVQKHCTAVK